MTIDQIQSLIPRCKWRWTGVDWRVEAEDMSGQTVVYGVGWSPGQALDEVIRVAVQVALA